eukprot:GILJ01014811.1.p1 GENE.GILJ01014811.1~~GILJ01014811.1.p1  ORF type:complete len:431 (+),score=86.56 GILJ01014811.1:160-1452(+)
MSNTWVLCSHARSSSPRFGKNPLSSALLSFLKTKYIFETSTKSNGVTSSEVAWTTIFDANKGIATGIANGSYNTPLPSSLMWDLMTETLFVFTLMNDGRNNATPADPNTVLRFQPSELLAELKAIAEKSGFAHAIAAGTSFENATANRELLILGLFAQITLVIVHVLIADFRGALREAAPLLIFGNGRRIIAELSGSAYINLYYHVGVAYVLLRRYTDAAQMLSLATAAPPVGNYDERVRNSSKSMLAMISVLAGLSLHEESADGDDDGVTDLRRGHLGRYRGTFFGNCPRFVTFGVAAEGQVNAGKEQVAETFLRQVQQQIPNITMRGHFNVYTTMNLEKVAVLRQNQNSKQVSNSVAAESSPFQIVFASQMAAVEHVHKADDTNPLSSTVAYAPAGKLRIEADFIASVASENLITDVLVKRIGEIHGQ